MRMSSVDSWKQTFCIYEVKQADQRVGTQDFLEEKATSVARRNITLNNTAHTSICAHVPLHTLCKHCVQVDAAAPAQWESAGVSH